MENTLIKCVNKLNQSIEKIKKNKNIELTGTIFLPILQFMIANDIITDDDSEKLLKNKYEIRKLKHYKFNDFINVSDEIENYLSEFSDELIEMLPKNIDIQSIDFLLYELLINIYKHSKFENAYIQLDTSQDNSIDICIIDDGIGIPGSFKEALIDFESDSDVIYEAINGKTTDKEKYKLRGRGLNSSVRITTLGFGGEMLIASEHGICIINKKGAIRYSTENRITGTFIIVRIQNKKVDNIYEYLKYEKITDITGVEHD